LYSHVMTQKQMIAFRDVLRHFDPECPMPDSQLRQLGELMFDKTIDMHIEAEESYKRTVVTLAVIRNFALRNGLYNLDDFLAFFDKPAGKLWIHAIHTMIDEACASAVVGAEEAKRPDQLN
jgi:hypothetical protein